MPALLLVTFFGFAGFAALMPTAPLWALEVGAGSAGAGMVNGILMLCTVASQPFVPWALRRFGWARTLGVGLALLGVPTLFFGLAGSLGTVLTLSGVRGLGFSILTVAGSMAVAELVEPGRRGKAVGAYGLAISVPQLTLLPSTPWLAEHMGFWLVFVLGALPVAAIPPALALARHLHQPDDSDRVPEQALSWRGMLPLARPMALLLAVTLASGAFITFTPQMSSDAAATTAGLLLLTSTAALARWRFGHWADVHGAHVFLWPLVCVTIVGLLLGAWAVIDPQDTSVVALLVGMALLGISYGGLQNLTLLESFSAVRPRDYGVASAAWNIGFDAGTGLGSVLVGALAAGYSFPVALVVCAAFSVLTLPLALMRQRGPSA
nr:MFS transporter [Zhihengliuella flava]